ncbi:hypothetical protein KAR91_64450 [Candidatus Pacearchaeota archaeon]|nr:hypothetical protein [Candidatus Pacearchaeota archaeon]
MSINCRHEGLDDLADDLLERTVDNKIWWLLDDFFESIIGRPSKGGLLCLVMAIILMV